MSNNKKEIKDGEKKPFYKKWWFWVIVVVVLIAIGGGSSSNNESSNTANSGQEAQQIEYQAVDIDTLENALDNNAAAAKDAYNGKYLEISGRLGVIDSDLKYISLLSPSDKFDLIGIHCTIKDSATKDVVKTLTKDQNIIVRGKITDVGEVMGYYLDIIEIIAQ